MAEKVFQSNTMNIGINEHTGHKGNTVKTLGKMKALTDIYSRNMSVS